MFEPNGKLTRSQVQQILVEYHRFQEQQKQVGFTVHLAYRDMLDFIFSYDTPNKLAEIEGPDGALRQELASRYLDWLREYYDSGVQLPEQWDEFESKLNNFFATQQAWAEQAEKAQAIVAHARELTTGTDVSADEFVNLLEALATIKSEFRSDLYDLYYRTALQDCVEELLDEAIGNMELREFKSATDAAFRAKSYATSEVLTDEKRDNLRGRCQDIAESIRSHEAFARLDANVRRVARATGSDDALALLEKESKNRDLLTEEFSGRISALRSELTENSEAYQKAVRLLGAIAEVESRTERLTKAKELDGIVETHGLGTLKSLTKRAYRDALVDNQQYDEAITQTNQIAVLDPSDKLAIGLCNFEKKEYSEAAKLFNAVKPKVIRNSKGASYLRAAGESNLNAMHPDKGFAFFKELKSLNEELGQRDLSIDNKLIECCRLRLERSNDQKLSLDEERHWRTEWKKLDGRQYDNLRELVRANYKLGQDALRKESTSSDAMRYFEEAYTDLRSYLTKNGYGGLSIDDQKIADRLYACFADYAPLDSGTTYVYENESTGTKREERRTAGGKKDDVKVTVQVEGVKIEQRWFKISDKLIREISGTNRPLLIRIPDPEQTKYEDSWGNQRVEITDIGQKFGTYQHCLIVRVYGREAGRNDYFEYTLAPDIGIVRELRASNPSQSTYVLKSRS